MLQTHNSPIATTCELAKHYLVDKKPSVIEIEIAFLLGYGDPSTFSAAFKSWHGHTPTEYRRSV